MASPRITLALAAAAALSLTAGGSALAADSSVSPGPIPSDGLEGIRWQLQEQLADGQLAPLPDGVVVTLVMEGGGAGGEGGCNVYSSDYTLDGSSLTFGPVTSTMMACDEPAMGVESAYFANLATTASWFSDGGSLTLQDASGATTLRFSPVPAAMPTDGIEGVTWQLVEYTVGGNAVASVPDGVTATLLLQGGHAGGSGGCNTFSGDYTLDGQGLTFGPLASTLMLCEGPGGEVETVYFATLPLVTGWSSDGGRLTLSDAGDSPVLTFEPAAQAGIEGSWVAGGINDGQGGVVTTAITPEVTAVFGPGGELAGSDGCNQYATTYAVDGPAIAIAPEIVSTRMACPSEEHSAQSAQYLAALSAATTWSVGPSGMLELRDDTGALQVSYVPATS